MTQITFKNDQYYLEPRIAGDIIFLSSGMGSEIESRLPEQESPIHKGSKFIAPLDAPDVVQTVHESYIAAGANIITTETFCASGHRQDGDWELTEKYITAASNVAEAARANVSNAPLIAVSLTSLECCYSPDKTPPQGTLITEHKKNLALLERHGDFTLAETLPTLREGQAIADNAQRPFVVSFVVDDDGKLLDGHNMEDVVRTILEPNAYCLGIGVNCCTIEGAKKAVAALAKIYNENAALAGKQIIAYPNGFEASREKNGHSCDDHAPERLSPIALAGHLWEMVALGATAVGGCCGAGPEHTEEYVAHVRARKATSERGGFLPRGVGGEQALKLV